MFYDPLIGKLVVSEPGREIAIDASRAALGGLRIEGLKTNVPALLSVLEDARFVSGRYDTGLLGK